MFAFQRLRAVRAISPSSRRMSHVRGSMADAVVAVLFQDIDLPIINGVVKPRKPNGKSHGAP